MKKFLFLLSLLLALTCLMAVTVFAEESEEKTYYLVSEVTDEAILNVQNEHGEISAGDVIDVDTLFSKIDTANKPGFINQSAYSKINFILCENLTTKYGDNVCINILNAKDVTIITNGYKWDFGSGRISAFFVNNHDAKLSIYGARGMYEDGSFVLYDDTDENPYKIDNKDFVDCDITSGNVIVWYKNGSIYMENLRTKATQETFYIESGGNENGRTIEFKNCAFKSDSCQSIASKNGGDTGRHTYKVNGGIYDGLWVHTPLTDSVIENCVIFGRNFVLDAWNVSNYALTFKNVDIEKSIETKTGRVYINLYDCTFGGTSLGSDGGGNSRVYSYKSATCVDNGTKTVYEKGKASYVDNSYVDIAKGHTFAGEISRVEYESLTKNGTYFGKCLNCDGEAEKDAMPIFKPMGYSFSVNGAIMQGFAVNEDALSKYENAEGEISFGVLVALKDKVSSDRLIDKNGEKLNEGDKVVLTDFTDKSYDIFEIKLSGLNANEEYKSLEVYVCGYYIVDETVYYLNLNMVADTLNGMETTFEKITQK